MYNWYENFCGSLVNIGLKFHLKSVKSADHIQHQTTYIQARKRIEQTVNNPCLPDGGVSMKTDWLVIIQILWSIFVRYRKELN